MLSPMARYVLGQLVMPQEENADEDGLTPAEKVTAPDEVWEELRQAFPPVGLGSILASE